MKTVDRSKNFRPDTRPPRQKRRVAASTLALALVLTLAPGGASWAVGTGPSNEHPPSTDPLTTPTPEEEGLADAPDTPPRVGVTSPTTQDSAPAPNASPAPPESDPPTESHVEDAPGAEANRADLPDLALTVIVKSDGTPDWDADSTAGNDSDPNNGIVRVNDTVTYEVEYAVPDGTAENTTFTLTFPRGMEITEVPGFCEPDSSSLTPEAAGELTLPLTANSIDELAEQVLVCNRGTISSGTDIVDVTVKVLNLAHQGQELEMLAAEISADGFSSVAVPSDGLPSVKASARLMWDISKNGISLTENGGYTYGPANIPCPWDTVITCKISSYSLLLSAPDGGKGAMPAIGDIEFTDDVSPASMYPSLSPDRIAAIEADLDTYGSGVYASATAYALPGSVASGQQEGADRTPVNSVTDSGTVTVAQAGRGKPARFTISGADMTLRKFPSEALRPEGTALPGNLAYAVSEGIRVYTPIATIRDFGIEAAAGGSWTLPTFNAYTELDIRGFNPDSDVQTSADQPGRDAASLPGGVAGPMNWNDYRRTTPTVELSGSFRKRFLGLPGLPGNMTAHEFSPGHFILGEGPPGGATVQSGNITVAPTQTITSQMVFVGSRPDAPAPVSAIGCDAWDNTQLNLHATDAVASNSEGQTSGLQRVPSGGEAAWVSGYNNVPGTYYATRKDQVPETKIQYSAVPGVEGSSITCGDDQGPWFDDPASVPGNDSALEAQGIYTAVSRVRAFASIPEPVSNHVYLGSGVNLAVSIGLRVADAGLDSGTILPNFAEVKMVLGEDLTPEQLLAHPRAWSTTGYTPGSHVGAGGDRLILAHAQARVSKLVRLGDTGEFSKTPPQVTGGDQVQYQLRPSLTSGASTPGILKDVWVEDCLPGSQIYSSATRVPSLVKPGVTASTMPEDAKRPACAAGETYIRWVIEEHEVNTVIEPIIMTVDVDPIADDGVYTNTVVVWAQDDASTLPQRTDDAQVQVSNVRGIRIIKQPLTPVVQVNRAGQGENELNEWNVRFSNRLPGDAPIPFDPDVIDVLPAQDRIGSDFHGSFEFHSAEVTDGSIPGQAVTISYTSAEDPAENPRSASNGASGATTWCDAPTGGDVVSGSGSAADCPATAAEVTAVRVQRPGPFSTGAMISFTIRMVGTDNRGGDVYVNRATAAAGGMDNVIRTAESPEVVIESSLGDYTWWDFNRNGTQDQWQGSDEQPASGIPVRLRGTDDLGNAVDLTTTSANDGRYLFPQLRSSNADGYTAEFTKPDASEFTVQGAGDDRQLDSNVDPGTGIADPMVIDRDDQDLSVDAGLLPLGGLQILKSVTGAGVGDFATTDNLKFQVVCTFDAQQEGADAVEVLNEEVTLSPTGSGVITSEVLGPLPAFASCTVTETDAGNADEPAVPVTVVVPWDTVAEAAGTVTASLTNFYSAGTVQVTKTLTGDEQAVAAAKDRVFEVLVTCQIEETDEFGDPIRVDVFSGAVKLTGGDTKALTDAAGAPVVLPLGARCFGEETNTGGAAESEVDFDSWENSVPVTSGTPEELQTLSIVAVNRFEDAALTVSKVVVGPGTGKAYDFVLECTVPGFDDLGESTGDIEYDLPAEDAKFSLADGASRTITIPSGATCRVAETNVPDGAKVSIVDSDDSSAGGAGDGEVGDLSGEDNTVKVTNTFSVPVTPPLPMTGGQLWGGAGVLGVLLLIAGAIVVATRRRSVRESEVSG